MKLSTVCETISLKGASGKLVSRVRKEKGTRNEANVSGQRHPLHTTLFETRFGSAISKRIVDQEVRSTATQSDLNVTASKHDV